MKSNDVLVERNESPVSRFSLLDDMRVERASKNDWEALHALHYKSEGKPPAASYWRCVTSSGDLVGVVVFSSVGLLHGARHEIFPKLKPNPVTDTKHTNVHRAKFINANFRRASRIVTDTLYRGAGVSYRMVNLAMRMEGKKYVEIVSSMSKFNPFDTKAGFKHANLRHALAYESGLRFFTKYFECHPADHKAVLDELEAMPASVRNGTLKAIRRFYYSNSPREKTGSNVGVGMRKVEAMSPSLLIREAQQLIFASPAYGIWSNPDLGREMPSVLPINAFDFQKPHEPLRLDLL